MNTNTDSIDEAAWEREFERVEAKQKQRETVTFSGGHSYEVPSKEAVSEK